MNDAQVIVDPRVRHRRAVERLRASYDAIPAGTPVRLAKPTTNLFRFREPAAGPGLNVSGLNRVLRVDAAKRTAEVQGMTTYEDLAEATLAHGLMPFVVPQLKTITLGGAVTGLGVESSSFRHGLPHESVLEMDILTGGGQLVTATRDNEHRDLFFGFPNSYGTLGYATRLVIELEPVKPYVHLRHVRFTSASECAEAIAEICTTGSHDGETVEFIDGTVFGPDANYLTLGAFTETAPQVSDYKGQEIFYKSIRNRADDYLTISDYLWRWDTDWFWCSRAFGAQNPHVRKLWPASKRRSDVYRRLVGLDKRVQFSARIERWRGRPPREDVIQDVEIPVAALPDFLEFFHREIPISPVWLCPIRAQDRWPLYPLDTEQTYVNVGFWSTVAQLPGTLPDHHNRLIEREVARLDGHKSLYSTSFYSKEEFWRHYDGAAYQKLKESYDPGGRLLDLYDKCVKGK